MTVDGQGGRLSGFSGWPAGALIRVDPDRAVRVVAESMLLRNGRGLTGDGRTLIVAESAGSGWWPRLFWRAPARHAPYNRLTSYCH